MGGWDIFPMAPTETNGFLKSRHVHVQTGLGSEVLRMNRSIACASKNAQQGVPVGRTGLTPAPGPHPNVADAPLQCDLEIGLHFKSHYREFQGELCAETA